MDEGRVIEDGPGNKVVSNYLCSDLGTTATREWPEPETAPGGRFVRLRAVRVVTDNDHATETVDIREPVKLVMEYEVLESGKVLLPHFALVNEKGDFVFVTIDQDPDWRRRPRPKGRYVSTALIPGNLLAEGTLLVNCNLFTLNPDILQFSSENTVAFHVVDSLDGDSARGEWAKNIPGVVRPLLKWTTQYKASAKPPAMPMKTTKAMP
jgi:lipopolysaccharide transport system ATP-binding protein